MSQNYKFKSLQIADKEESSGKPKGKNNEFSVFEVGNTKSIDFIMLDGTRQNFAYSHYITAWFGIEEGNKTIKIFFATHLVTIKGFCLEKIYEHLITFSLKAVESIDKRYLQDKDEVIFVTDIKITWKGREE